MSTITLKPKKMVVTFVFCQQSLLLCVEMVYGLTANAALHVPFQRDCTCLVYAVNCLTSRFTNASPQTVSGDFHKSQLLEELNNTVDIL